MVALLFCKLQAFLSNEQGATLSNLSISPKTNALAFRHMHGLLMAALLFSFDIFKVGIEQQT